MKKEEFDINKDLVKLIYDNFRNAPKDVKLGFIEEGECLDFYTYDEDPEVRYYVAYQNHNLDILKNDEDRAIRILIASRGFYTEEFRKDKDFTVRIIANTVSEGNKMSKLCRDKGVDEKTRSESFYLLLSYIASGCIDECVCNKWVEGLKINGKLFKIENGKIKFISE